MKGLDDIGPRTWVYTQSLSDGRTFVQAFHLNHDASVQVAVNNSSVEAYTKERAWWIKESVTDCRWHIRCAEDDCGADSGEYLSDWSEGLSLSLAAIPDLPIQEL